MSRLLMIPSQHLVTPTRSRLQRVLLQRRCKGETPKPTQAAPKNFSGSCFADVSSAAPEKTKEEKQRIQKESGVELSAVTFQEQVLGEGKRAREKNLPDVPDAQTLRQQVNKIAAIMVSISLFTLGGTLLAVPVYKLYCTSAPQAAGGNSAQRQSMENIFENEDNVPSIASVINVIFRGSLGSKESPVLFVPLQNSIDTLIGEPTLAFFNVYNKTDKTLIGLSTYNVAPGEVCKLVRCWCS